MAIVNDEVFPFRLPFFRALSHTPLDVRVLFLSRPGHRRWHLPENLGFDHEFLPSLTVPLPRRSLGERRRAHAAPTLFARLAGFRPEVVVAYAFSLPTLTAWLYCRVSGARFAVWSEGTAHTEADNSVIQDRLRRLLLPGAAACLAGSTAAAERMVELGATPARVHLVAHAADPAVFGHVPQRTRLPHESIYVGELCERKGAFHLLESFSRVRQELPSATLRLVGTGPLLGELTRRADEPDLRGAVSFDGYLQQGAVARRLAGAALFAFPTLRDTFGQVIAEAATAGLPLVSSPLAGAAGEFVHEGRNGFLRDPCDHEAFAHAMVSVLADDRRRLGMGRASREIADSLAVERVAGKVADALERVARSKTTHRGDGAEPHEEPIRHAS